jgi:DNA primase
VHEAKPHLQKLAAPILRVLVKGRGPRRIQAAATPSSVEYKLLLHKPEWAARLPLELIDRERVEGDALHAIANAIEHGELPAGGFGMLLEFFRGTPHEALIAAIAANMTEEVDLAALEGVFNDSVVRLRHTAITAEIEQLTARAGRA